MLTRNIMAVDLYSLSYSKKVCLLELTDYVFVFEQVTIKYIKKDEDYKTMTIVSKPLRIHCNEICVWSHKLCIIIIDYNLSFIADIRATPLM